MLDDKASIAIGQAGAPIGAARRQRKTLQVENMALDSCDHDVAAQHLTPSVSIVMDPPEHVSGFYGGCPEVTLKCSIFQPSNSFRHMAELSKRLTVDNESVALKPFLFILSDGGPDHNTIFIQTQLSVIALFLKHDLDYICCVRTPPNFSTLNPVEKFMCTANLALVGLALAREEGPHEDVVKNLTSKDQWRKAATKYPHLNIPKLAADGVQNCRNLIEERLSRLSYKGEEIKIGKPATQNDILELKECLQNVLSDQYINFDKVTKSQVLKSSCFKSFYDIHCRETQYGFQIKKCSDPNCTTHCSVRAPFNDFENLKWLPSPKMGIDGKFKSFEDSYGEEPSDRDRPGKNKAKSCDKKPTWQLQATKARMILVCSECQYPRLLYSLTKLTEDELGILMDYFEDNPYVCGSDIEIKDKKIQEVYQTPKTMCNAKISSHYYKRKDLKGYKLICCFCLDENVMIPDKDERCPICDICHKKYPQNSKKIVKKLKTQ